MAKTSLTNNKIMQERFTEAQLALIEMFSMKMSKSEINELKKILSDFCAELAQRKIDKLVSAGKWPSDREIENIRRR